MAKKNLCRIFLEFEIKNLTTFTEKWLNNNYSIYNISQKSKRKNKDQNQDLAPLKRGKPPNFSLGVPAEKMNGEEHPFSFLRHDKLVNRVQVVNGFPLLNAHYVPLTATSHWQPTLFYFLFTKAQHEFNQKLMEQLNKIEQWQNELDQNLIQTLRESQETKKQAT